MDDHLVHQSHHQGVEHHGHGQHHRGSPTAAEQGLAQTFSSMQHNKSPYGEPMDLKQFALLYHVALGLSTHKTWESPGCGSSCFATTVMV